MSGKLERFARELAAKAARLEVPVALEDRFARYARDPVAFAQDVLGIEELPAYQAAVLRDVAAEERVAWVAGHATGKSHAAAVLLAWYLLTRPGSRCLVTSATYERHVGRVISCPLLDGGTRAVCCVAHEADDFVDCSVEIALRDGMLEKFPDFVEAVRIGRIPLGTDLEPEVAGFPNKLPLRRVGPGRLAPWRGGRSRGQCAPPGAQPQLPSKRARPPAANAC